MGISGTLEPLTAWNQFCTFGLAACFSLHFRSFRYSDLVWCLSQAIVRRFSDVSRYFPTGSPQAAGSLARRASLRQAGSVFSAGPCGPGTCFISCFTLWRRLHRIMRARSHLNTVSLAFFPNSTLKLPWYGTRLPAWGSAQWRAVFLGRCCDEAEALDLGGRRHPAGVPLSAAGDRPARIDWTARQITQECFGHGLEDFSTGRSAWTTYIGGNLA